MRFRYLRQKINKFQSLKKSVGLKNLFKMMVCSYREEVILMKDLNDLMSFPFKNDLEIEKIEKKTIKSLLQIRDQSEIDKEDSYKMFNEYLCNNCKGFIAKLKGEIIGYIWWANNTMQSNFSHVAARFYSKEIKLSPTDVYMFDYFIVDRHRGGGNGVEFLSKVLTELKNLGYKRSFGYVVTSNLPAMWLYRLTSFKDMKKVKVLRLFLYLVFRNNRPYFDKILSN
jgi:GNAT superfamily N-acetyltransferase